MFHVAFHFQREADQQLQATALLYYIYTYIYIYIHITPVLLLENISQSQKHI
jgi:hypothetical protein